MLSSHQATISDARRLRKSVLKEKSTLKITEEFGDLRFIKFINEMIWVAFNNYKLALDAVEKGSIEVCGHTLTISLKNLG